MARTWHHGKRNRARLFCEYHSTHDWEMTLSPEAPRGVRWVWGQRPEPTPPKKKRYAREGNWMRTPGWWIREMMTRPQRAKTRLLLRKIVTGKLELEDVARSHFGHPRKPHVYYW